MRKSEVREMPSLPRGGGEELVRDEQVSSRRVRFAAFLLVFADWKIHSVCVCVCMLVLICMGFIITILTVVENSVCVFTETIRRLFEQAAEDGHVPQISPYCE